MKHLRLVALVLSLLLPSWVGAKTYNLAVTDVEGMEKLQLEWSGFKEALERASGYEFKFFPVSNRTAAVEALRAKRLDFVVSGPAEYVVINKMTEATPLIGLGRPDYFCAVVVMAESPYLRVTELKGKKVAFKDVGSTSGHLCPMQLMQDLGLDPVKDITRIHTSRNVMHEALKRGDVQAIGVNHNSWVDKARNKDTRLEPGAFRIIARSGDLPNDMLIVAAHVDPSVAKQVRKGILDHSKEVIQGILAHEENLKYEGMKLRSIQDKDYNLVRAMYTTAGFPQYDRFIGE
ncbi:MAG: PhnD/SsuA/transferrin family substrate-binding protein [Gammaproteobacteria bacterium]|nr:PhnD/SsuA/transferrin family substrate-binding protein [Gammaproteobacteria bacterium]